MAEVARFLLPVQGYDSFFFFFFNDRAPPELSPLPLHAALPICPAGRALGGRGLRDGDQRSPTFALHAPHDRVRFGDASVLGEEPRRLGQRPAEIRDVERGEDRKSTRLNSSHLVISYAVFCLKKK